MTTDNFTELKRLFEQECDMVAKAHKEPPCSLARYSAVASVLSKLLDGYTIELAKWMLEEAKKTIDASNKVRADEIAIRSLA